MPDEDPRGSGTGLDIHRTLLDLAIKRPLFHSEDDFKFALAWSIQRQHPSWKIRLEWPFVSPDDNGSKTRYVDLRVKSDKGVDLIELKYPTAELPGVRVGDEEFNLKTHSAPDYGRAYFWEDVVRLEWLLQRAETTNARGIAIFLSNDTDYWENPERKGYRAKDWNFRLRSEMVYKRTLLWNAPPKTRLDWPWKRYGTTKSCLRLSGSYRIEWRLYSRDGAFRYVALPVFSG